MTQIFPLEKAVVAQIKGVHGGLVLDYGPVGDAVDDQAVPVVFRSGVSEGMRQIGQQHLQKVMGAYGRRHVHDHIDEQQFSPGKGQRGPEPPDEGVDPHQQQQNDHRGIKDRQSGRAARHQHYLVLGDPFDIDGGQDKRQQYRPPGDGLRHMCLFVLRLVSGPCKKPPLRAAVCRFKGIWNRWEYAERWTRYTRRYLPDSRQG